MTRNDPLVISLVALGHATSHFMQLVLPPLFPLMREELGVTYATLGMVAALFYAVSALLQPLAGFVVDRYGGRGVLLGGIGLMSFAHDPGLLMLGALVSGLAIAPVFSATLGSVFGWHMALLAGAGVACAVFLLLLFNMNQLAFVHEKRAQLKTPFMEDVRVLRSGRVVACVMLSVAAGAIPGAALPVALAAAGIAVGSFATPVFYGWLMDHSLPHGVFYTIFGFTLLAMFTVLQLPGRTRTAAAT